MMKLLDLVIVDDEPILLKGLLKTYDWDQMGFQVVGTALSGEQAIEVIREKKPDVVLTDIRMKQMTGLQMMDTIQQTGQECLFVVLSAYRDFEYAKEACDLGAFAYLLKPIEDDKLQETMQNAYRSCMEKQKKEERMESWEKLVMKDATSFLQVIVQKYLFNQISFDKLTVDKQAYDLIVDGKRVDAPPKEIELLYFLASNPNRVFTRAQLLDDVWGFDYFGDTRTVDVHVKRLREKLEGVSDKWDLKTVWGVGYKFETRD